MSNNLLEKIDEIVETQDLEKLEELSNTIQREVLIEGAGDASAIKKSVLKKITSEIGKTSELIKEKRNWWTDFFAKPTAIAFVSVFAFILLSGATYAGWHYWQEVQDEPLADGEGMAERVAERIKEDLLEIFSTPVVPVDSEIDNISEPELVEEELYLDDDSDDRKIDELDEIDEVDSQDSEDAVDEVDDLDEMDEPRVEAKDEVDEVDEVDENGYLDEVDEPDEIDEVDSQDSEDAVDEVDEE